MKKLMYQYQITAMIKPEHPGYRQNVEIIWASNDASAQRKAELLISFLPQYDPTTMEIHRLKTALLSVY
jgi:hypothetical protein